MQIFDSAARPLLQQKTIDEAQTDLEGLSQAIKEKPGVVKALAEIGAEMDENKGFILSDIHLPEEVKKARLKRLEGSTTADQTAAVGEGYARAIENIRIRSGKDLGGGHRGKPVVSYDQAVQIFERQRALEALQNSGANITLMGENLEGVQKSFIVGSNQPAGPKSKGGGRKKPPQGGQTPSTNPQP
jgi:hypothetical protein